MSSVLLVRSFLFHSTEKKKNPDVSILVTAKEKFKSECTIRVKE